MKPIIIEMKDMSDSTEVYQSRPNPFMIYFIYLLVIIFVALIAWMYFFEIDIVVKGNGMLRSDGDYYAEVYVRDDEIARLNEGQKVKLEISAYPSSEYGYFTGKIENIAEDITIDQTSGISYYVVNIECNKNVVKGKDGEEYSLRNGMSCQAKVIVDEENVMRYLLKKIDLWE